MKQWSSPCWIFNMKNKNLPKLGPVLSMKDSNMRYQKVRQIGSPVVGLIGAPTSEAVPVTGGVIPRVCRAMKYSWRGRVEGRVYGLRWFRGFRVDWDTRSQSTRPRLGNDAVAPLIAVELGSRLLTHSHSSISKVQSRGKFDGAATWGDAVDQLKFCFKKTTF